MAIEIKILQRGDEAVLANVTPDVFDDPVDAQASAAFLTDDRHHIAVAVDEGVVVGFASAVHYLHPDKSHPELWINEVGVAPGYQQRGIGKMLMKAILDVGRALGCSGAWVLTNHDNTAAKNLYASAGGAEEPEGTVMFSFSLEDAE